LGSLTESAAASATRFSGRYGERGGSGYEDQYPERISYAGRGPKGYRRADERIREDVCELLTRSHDVDASNIEVTVHEGTVLLSGMVEDRRSKRIAEDLAQEAWGAKDVQNQIRVDSGLGRVKPETTGGVQTAQGSSSGSVLGLNQETTRR
jgi:osmotically-inducible protein OsmY